MAKINVVAAVIKRNNQYLIAQRNRKKYLSWMWEFPGGKVEENESFEECLKREIEEELSIKINIHKKITETEYKDDKIDILLHYFLCSIKSGKIQLNEHEDLAWIEAMDFDKFNFAGGDDSILSLL